MNCERDPFPPDLLNPPIPPVDMKPLSRLYRVLKSSPVVVGALLGSITGTSIELPLAHAQTATSDPASVAPGHSSHADAFNEGPRQAAYLMPGMGNVHWKISTKNAMAQRFFDQGIVQLHGFWYFEAERSFRQAAAFDPECGIFYWGMARANIENIGRSKGFIEQAINHISSASPLEKKLIEAWHRRVKDLRSDEEIMASRGDELNEQWKKFAQRPRRSKEDTDREKEKLGQYVKDLEALCLEFPQEIELKAMLVLQYWQNEGVGHEVQSRVAMNALLSDIFRENPRHPAHHFRIHLWDYRDEKFAVEAAAACGPSAPGIAHMWHMPGHTYSRLHRYNDAAWQQEASARVDHAHMIRDYVMPDQIHNFAHNNEWLIRNLIHVGRVGDALDLAKNMIELPRHPRYNRLDGRGSASLGRERLIQVLKGYRLWNEMLELSDTTYLDPAGDEVRADELLSFKGIAHSQLNHVDEYQSIRDTIEQRYLAAKADRNRLAEELRLIVESESKNADPPRRPPQLLEPFEIKEEPLGILGSPNDPLLPPAIARTIDSETMKDWSAERKKAEQSHRDAAYRVWKLGQIRAGLDAYFAASQMRFDDALRISHEGRGVVTELERLEWCSMSGRHDLALQEARKRVDEGPAELLPLITGLWIANRALPSDAQANGGNSTATGSPLATAKSFAKSICEMAATADKGIVVLDRLRVVADSLGFAESWGKAPPAPEDVGQRPLLSSLGPFRWVPNSSPMWSAPDADGVVRHSKQYLGRPHIVVLYLGFGCLHCAEQLRAFTPMVEKYKQAGIDVVGISTENQSSLVSGLKKYDAAMPITLMANPELDIFKSFRCFDDFEGTPLHGTFLVDGEGRVRWQDVGPEPFMDVEFLLQESQRLLKLR